MPNQSSHVASSPSTPNFVDRPTAIAFPFSGIMDRDMSKANTNTGLTAATQGIPYPPKDSSHIQSPPAINNWHAMSTAATTITSNIHPRVSLRQQREAPPHWLAMDLPPHYHYPADTTVVIDDDLPNSNTEIPPVCEIQIPSHQRPKRRADIDDDCDYDDDDNDADTTTSTQNLSRHDHQYSNAIDYKGMYFASQRQNYMLREEVQCVKEDNRKLKRQLIEMQKQLYAYSRNKRAATSSMYHHANWHVSHDTNERVPWSIPVSTNQVSRHENHSQPRVLMVRQRHSTSSNPNVIEHSIISPVIPTKTTTSMETLAATATTTTTTTASPLIPDMTTASPTNGVSISVSSEEGNTSH